MKVPIRNQKFLWIKKEEVELFEQILLHRTMYSKSVHLFYRKSSETLQSTNAISNRLTKLVEYEFLIRLTKDVSVTRARVPRYYYRLGRRGLRLLAEQKKVILNNQMRKDFRLFKNSPVPSNHTDAMSILANQIYLFCREEHAGIAHSRGVTMKIFDGQGREQLIRKEGVVPDWVFQNKNRILCIELDTGSQEYQVIERKFAKYQALHRELSNEGYQITVLFAVLDESIDIVQKNKRQERSGRVSGLNRLFENYISQPISEGRQHHLLWLKRVYTVPAKKAPAFVSHLFGKPQWDDSMPMEKIMPSLTDKSTEEGEEPW